jgi:two-component system nitrate/nitrite response regulator NarL
MIRVGIIEDHPLTMRGLREVVAADPELELVAIAGDYESSCTWADPVPTVVVLDLLLPGVSGAEAVLALRQRGARVLVVSMMEGRDNVVEAIGSGASGYLTKQAEFEEITAAIKLVAEDGMYVSPTLAGYLLRKSEDDDDAGLGVRLTPRELDVLRLLAQGETDKSIAGMLGISRRTVGDYVTSIRRKLEEVYGPVTRTRMTRLFIENKRDGGGTH